MKDSPEERCAAWVIHAYFRVGRDLVRRSLIEYDTRVLLFDPAARKPSPWDFPGLGFHPIRDEYDAEKN